MDERNKCFIDFYRFNDTIDINQIRFTFLIDMHVSILLFIDLLLRLTGNKKQLCTFLPLFCTTTTWTFLGSHFMEKQFRMYFNIDFVACVIAQSIQSVPSLPGICRAFGILFWKSCKCITVGPSVHTKTPRWGLKTKRNEEKSEQKWSAPHKLPLAADKNYRKKDDIWPSDQYQWQNYKLEF